MNKLLASELGFLGINVDSNFDLAWLKTEVADKIREGDQTSIYKLINFARHSEDPEIRRYAGIIENLYKDKIDAYNETPVPEKEEIHYEEAKSVEDIDNLLDGEEPEVNIEVTEDITLDSGKFFTVPEGKKVNMKLDSTMTCETRAFNVANGGELTLTGNGTLVETTKNTNAAINVDGKDAKLIIDGITIDAITSQGKKDNYSYGIYLLNDASVEFKSGTIKTAYGSCISSNNTTGGSSEINIRGGELLSDGSYAIYLPAQGTVNITGGKVQGINARMGHFNISGDAEIISTTLTESDYDNIGSNFATSGCVWLGDAIAVMAGTYTDEDGTDAVFNISGNATVKSDFRSAIGIYSVDTKQAQNVSINISNSENIKTTDTDFEDIKVYDHDYIQSEATAAGKTYTPVADSIISINVI